MPTIRKKAQARENSKESSESKEKLTPEKKLTKGACQLPLEKEIIVSKKRKLADLSEDEEVQKVPKLRQLKLNEV